MKKILATALLVIGLAATAAPALGGDDEDMYDCKDCPAPKVYDSEEVVKSSRDIDRSRTISTTTVVPVSRRVKETNHLIVHQNETRNVGVIRHNHTIIEKETRYVRRRPAEIVVNFVTQKYRVVERPALYEVVPVSYRPVRDCYRSKRYGRYGSSCGPVLRSRG